MNLINTDKTIIDIEKVTVGRQLIKIEGEVDEAELVYKRITRVKPIEHHYEESGEKPYIKYGCPVCEALNNHHQIPYNTSNCPLCSVNLLW